MAQKYLFNFFFSGDSFYYIEDWYNYYQYELQRFHGHRID